MKNIGIKGCSSSKSKFLDHAELIENRRLEQIKNSLKKAGITTKSLDKIVEKQGGNWNPKGLKRKELEDILISLFSILEDKHRQNQKLQRSISEKKQIIEELKSRLPKVQLPDSK